MALALTVRERQPVYALSYTRGVATKVADAAGLAPFLAGPLADFYANA